ncbi:2-C-methyl-D-erythritol 4-phosphate cytidylyltransferase [Aliidiomarina taiwanensis]|uniref:Ribitol-5-phosphate cytidylyltransferase n=1 Tax=Aliidiomarina taiwanensis TaxID=946228 RepID=A0A432X8Q4_9GAMM|nr:IspD/TarI family cytidylyltransferase [Aliidiomarina taiwanensis]RUO43783.1 2-C-methyl-D-erythritol 4-phosphate cytidylyltransferase [Aliidiomarina taiwanensis]
MSDKNIAIIFSGGVGARMNSKAKPKQFLELHGKPIIVYTLELFENHPEIDAIVIAILADWVDYMNELIVRYQLTKVVAVVEGGKTGQLSIYNGLLSATNLFSADSTVLIHDGVRPLINQQIISANIDQVKKSGNAITTSPTIETFVVVDDNMLVQDVPSRKHSRLAKAPQSFVLSDILAVHQQALQDGVLDSIDSCTLMSRYGYKITLVEGPVENIKITTPTDYFMFRAIVESRENSQIFGG